MKQVLLTFTNKISSLISPNAFFQVILEIYQNPEVEVQEAKIEDKNAIVILLLHKNNYDVLSKTIENFESYFLSYSEINEKPKE